MENNKIVLGDCLDLMNNVKDESVDLIYMDPPFYTQTVQKLSDKQGRQYSFDDSWATIEDYVEYIRLRFKECRRVLKDTGSIFVHCDRNASHYLKIALDKVFGEGSFQSEIVWSYKRWSNSKKGLLNNHQIIFFIAKQRILNSILCIQTILKLQMLIKSCKTELEMKMVNQSIKLTTMVL